MGKTILYQLESILAKFTNTRLRKLSTESEFKTNLKNLFNQLTNTAIPEQLIIVPDNVDPLYAFTENLVAMLKDNNAISSEEINKFNDFFQMTNLKEKFLAWQEIFKALFTTRAAVIEEILWKGYLEQQKKVASDPSSAFNNESFEGLVCQALADFLKRAGAMLFEYVSEAINGQVYINSEGRSKLFVEIDNVKPGAEQFKDLCRTMTGNRDLPPGVANPAPRP